MFRTGSNNPIEFKNIPEALNRFYNSHKSFDAPMSIIVGTDSQNFDKTKMVSVIAMVCQGHGGIFFYQISHINRITNVRQKLQTETADSLDIAGQIVDMLESDDTYKNMYDNCPISIHVDAGNSEHGKTKALIPELVGWIKACGYDVRTKPESFVASTIADRISK